MEVNNSEPQNELNNLAGDYEALGLDLQDIKKMVHKPKVIEAEINELKKLLEQALKTKVNMLNKLGIQSED